MPVSASSCSKATSAGVRLKLSVELLANRIVFASTEGAGSLAGGWLPPPGVADAPPPGDAAPGVAPPGVAAGLTDAGAPAQAATRRTAISDRNARTGMLDNTLRSSSSSPTNEVKLQSDPTA